MKELLSSVGRTSPPPHRSRWRLFGGLGVTLWVLSAATVAQGQVLYKTGFEKHDFGLGPLVGQQGFVEWRGWDGGAASVVAGCASSGRQAVSIDGRLVTNIDPTLDWPWEYYYYHEPLFGYDVAASGKPIITFKCNLMLRNLGDTPNDWIGLAIYTQGGIRVAYMTIGTDELFWFENGWYSPGPPLLILPGVEYDRYYSVKMEYNFATSIARYWLDGQLVYTSEAPLEPAPIDWVLGDIDMIIGSADRTRPAHVIGCFDKFEIKASAEPEE